MFSFLPYTQQKRTTVVSIALFPKSICPASLVSVNREIRASTKPHRQVYTYVLTMPEMYFQYFITQCRIKLRDSFLQNIVMATNLDDVKIQFDKFIVGKATKGY